MELNPLSTCQTGFALADLDLQMAAGNLWEGATATTNTLGKGRLMTILWSVGVQEPRIRGSLMPEDGCNCLSVTQHVYPVKICHEMPNEI